jgi:hypothetical protein
MPGKNVHLPSYLVERIEALRIPDTSGKPTFLEFVIAMVDEYVENMEEVAHPEDGVSVIVDPTLRDNEVRFIKDGVAHTLRIVETEQGAELQDSEGNTVYIMPEDSSLDTDDDTNPGFRVSRTSSE